MVPYLDPWTLSIMPRRIEEEYWQFPRLVTRLLDSVGLVADILICSALLRFAILSDIYRTRCFWPALGLATSAVQLYFVRRQNTLYFRYRTVLQLAQRVGRYLPLVAMAQQPAYGYATQVAYTRQLQGISGSDTSMRSLLFLLSVEPFFGLMAALNFTLPFRYQLPLFLGKLVLDMLGTTQLLGCVLVNLQLQPARSSCFAVDMLAMVLFALSPPLDTAHGICAQQLNTFLPAFCLVTVGGIVPLLAAWWFEAKLKLHFLARAGHEAAAHMWPLQDYPKAFVVLQAYTAMGLAFVLSKLAAAYSNVDAGYCAALQ